MRSELAAAGATRGDAGARALRLHVRRHQQPQLRAAARAARAIVLLQHARQARSQSLAALAHRLCGRADARAHARPAREPHHARQGSRELRRAHPSRARSAGRASPSSASGTAPSATSMRTSPPRRMSTGPRVSQRFVESLGLQYNAYTTQIEPHDWIAEYCDAVAAHRHGAHRPVPRLLGLHLARLFPPAAGRRRSRLLDDAAQGESHRFRECRRQSRRRERAAASLRGQAADLALAARPHGLHRAAQSRRRARRMRSSPGARSSAASPRSRPTRRASPRTSTTPGKCSARPCRPCCAPPACRTATSS